VHLKVCCTKQYMNVIGWRYAMKGPNLHVRQAHFGKNPVVLHVAIY
jgi:hypothetical protein